MTEAEITADDADLPGVILTMRLANMGAAVALIVVAVSAVARTKCVICRDGYRGTK